MKKVLAIILTIVMVLSSTTVVALAAQQEYNFEDNRISLSLRHSDYVVSLENFSKYGVIEIEETSKYWYVLTLDKHDHQNVLDVISQLEHAEDAYKYSVHVIYIPVEDPFKDSEIKAKFVEEYEEPQFYDEIYYHYFDEEKTMLDWVLINAVVDVAYTPIENPTPRRFIVGDIVYSTVYYYGPFIVPYCVYDAEKDEFIGISQVNFDEYEGLREVFCTSTYGKVIGDVDSDGQLSVMDATEIQRHIAKTINIKSGILPLANTDKDNAISIMDVTQIQLFIAKRIPEL